MNSNDMQELYDLAQTNTDVYWHAVNLPYRLASWALDNERNGRLWRNADGSLAAGAIRQGAWAELDAVLPPATWANGIADAVIAWGCECARHLQIGGSHPYVQTPTDCHFIWRF